MTGRAHTPAFAMVGWRQGSFVCEMLGEIIPDQVAEQRGLEYDRAGISYLMDLAPRRHRKAWELNDDLERSVTRWYVPRD